MKDNLNKQRLVIIGGGFGGLNLAKKIDKRKYDVTLLDCNNFHSFPPLFYQVASAGIDPAGICFPLRREMRKYRNKGGVKFNMTRVKSIDTTRHTVTSDDETIPYDILVIAAGTTNNYFNMPGLKDKVHTIKSTAEAIRCRNDLLDLLEKAAMEPDEKKRRHMLSFVVVGGGPAGVEIAGALGEMKRYVLPREYPYIKQDEVTITLLEGSDHILNMMTARSSLKALEYLKSLMVDVKLGHNFTAYEDGVVTLDDSTAIDASLVIWTAGVKGVPFEFTGNAVTAGRGGRIEVDEHCRVKGVDDVYAIGDIALMKTPRWPYGHPQLAQAAIQQGRMLAHDLNAGHTGNGFEYVDKGAMATIGRNRAVVDLKHTHFDGFAAWLTWMFIHLISLLGMRNKVSVLIDWIWSYFTYTNSTRLLLHPAKYPLRRRWEKE